LFVVWASVPATAMNMFIHIFGEDILLNSIVLVSGSAIAELKIKHMFGSHTHCYDFPKSFNKITVLAKSI
jgi:hypothetical protein